MPATVFNVMFVLWLLSEVVVSALLCAKSSDVKRVQKSSVMGIWVVVGLSLLGGFGFRQLAIAQMPVDVSVYLSVGIVLIFAGMLLRWWAIIVLGNLFTVNIAIHSQHELVQTGLYRFLRHPSYTGVLLSFVGFGIGMGNWLSLIFAVAPMVAIISYRIHIEESALLQAFGSRYANYCAQTKRLVPGIY